MENKSLLGKFSKRFLVVAFFSVLFLLMGVLVFIPDGKNKEAFQSLWAQGRQAMEQENYVVAAEKLEEAVSYIGNTVGEQEFELVKEVGRVNAPGRPILFGTTEEFLRRFGFSSLDEMPQMDPVSEEDIKAEAEVEVTV